MPVWSQFLASYPKSSVNLKLVKGVKDSLMQPHTELVHEDKALMVLQRLPIEGFERRPVNALYGADSWLILRL